MVKLSKVSYLFIVLILMSLLISCSSEQADEVTSTPKANVFDSAREAVGEAGESIGAAVEQAADGAGTALESVGDTAQTAAAQVGEVIEAAGTVVDQGGAAVEAVSSAGQSASETVRERFSSLKPDEEGNFSVTIHEGEINQIIKIQELLTAPIPGNPLRNTTVAFQNGVILFRADVFEPFVGKLIITFNPYVEEGHVRFEVIDASLGDTETSQDVLDTAADTLNSTLGEALGYLPSGLRPREIVIANGSFTINGGGEGDGG